MLSLDLYWLITIEHIKMESTPLSILMADDDIEDLELFESAITGVQPGITLHKCNTGKEAVEYLANRHDDELPCLIVLDYNMPELTGSEVLSIICKNERYQHIPKIILSTSNAPIHVHECMSNGATAYLVKPNSLSEINKLARKMLGFCEQ
jgi:CheY-like chemotaxis protein